MELVPVRFPPDVIDLLEAERERLAALAPGMPVKRCDAVRVLVKEALDKRKVAAKR